MTKQNKISKREIFKGDNVQLITAPIQEWIMGFNKELWSWVKRMGRVGDTEGGGFAGLKRFLIIRRELGGEGRQELNWGRRVNRRRVKEHFKTDIAKLLRGAKMEVEETQDEEDWNKATDEEKHAMKKRKKVIGED